MIYLSIDTETTGLDFERCQLLSFAAIIEDTKNLKSFEDSPKVHYYIVNDFITGSPYALNMNKDIIEKISIYQRKNKEEREKYSNELGVEFIKENELVTKFTKFLRNNGFHENPPIHLTVVGKNFSTFDKIFLERVPQFTNLIKFRNRIGDPMHYFIDWEQDEVFPNTDTCIKRSGLNIDFKHDALTDSWDMILLMRKQYER